MFKITVVAVLLSGVLAFAVAAVSPQPMHHSSAPPAGCHHGGKTPSPQPISYTCCQAGHSPALLQAPYQQGMLLAGILSGHIVSDIGVTSSSVESSYAAILAQPPPGGLPLRI